MRLGRDQARASIGTIFITQWRFSEVQTIYNLPSCSIPHGYDHSGPADSTAEGPSCSFHTFEKVYWPGAEAARTSKSR